jgi:hypothetical protein
MIVRILSRGKSFSGLATYLTHDPKAETKERVAWTHTLNLANDHVPSAVDEMLWTSRNAELLKQEAGIRAGGRETENSVKHLSLNWAPDQRPTREHMIETANGFLEHMHWQEHQALIVAHSDRAHAHVHLMLNVVHPETGLRLDDNFERRRAQTWAAEYERSQGRIYCEQRQLAPEEREDAPTRPMWMAFKEKEIEFERVEKFQRENESILVDVSKNPENSEAGEWRRLKDIQKQQRLAFMAEGKLAFSELRRSIYQDVREDFREDWAAYYEARKNGGDPAALAILKAELVADQNTVLAARRDEACMELRLSRDETYRDLLDDQRDLRHGLRSRQEAGLDNAHFLDRAEQRSERNMSATFGEGAIRVTVPANDNQREDEPVADSGRSRSERSGAKSGADVGAKLGQGIGFSLISLFESMADGFVGAKPDFRKRAPEPEPRDPNAFDVVIDEARKRQRIEQEEADEDWRKRQRPTGD